jgi:DNA-directed RNA polymerase specialized sigma24 family protein
MLTQVPVVQDLSRLNALRRIGVLDTPAEECFDRLTRIAAAGLHTPVSLISLVEEDRQFFKSCLGLPEPWASERETPLSHSICQHVVAAREPLVVVDAREHQMLRDNLALRDLGVVAYLGVPLITTAGVEIGALCVIDREPRAWSAEEVALLRDLAATAVTLIETRADLRGRQTTDGALLARSRAGDDAALGELYDRYADVLYAVAHAATGSEEAAEDAVADALVRAPREAPPAIRSGDVRAWLVVHTRRCALEQARAAATSPMPDEVQCVVDLVRFGKLTVPEIARELDLPAATVKARMRCALDLARTRT